MGTATESFVDLSERIGRKTGGVSVSPSVLSRKGSPEPLGYITVRGKAMADKAGDMMDVVRDVLLTARLDDRERFKQVCGGGGWTWCGWRGASGSAGRGGVGWGGARFPFGGARL